MKKLELLILFLPQILMTLLVKNFIFAFFLLSAIEIQLKSSCLMYNCIYIFSMNRMERIVLNGKITHCARRVIGGTALDGYLIQEVLKGPLQ